jgi:hypothetical protein
MFRIRLLIIGVFFLGLTIVSNTMAWGESWKQYGVDESGEFYYDAESITRPTTTTVKVWTKMVHSKENLKNLGKGLENLLYSKRLWEINCSDKKIRRLSKIAFSKDEKILISDNKEENWQSIISKSLSEILLENVCR